MRHAFWLLPLGVAVVGVATCGPPTSVRTQAADNFYCLVCHMNYKSEKLAARHKDGRWVMAYLDAKAEFSIHMDKFTTGKEAKALWIDPRSGETASAGVFPAGGVQVFSTPEGWEDALLILEPPGG